MAKIAVTDGMAEDAVVLLRKAGHEVDLLSSSSDLVGYDAVVIRSATKITSNVISSSPSLKKSQNLKTLS